MNKNFGKPSKVFIKVLETNCKGSHVFIKADEYEAQFYPITKTVNIEDCIKFINDKSLIFSGIGGLEEIVDYNLDFLKSGESIYSFDIIKNQILIASIKNGNKKIISDYFETNKIIKAGYLMALDIIV